VSWLSDEGDVLSYVNAERESGLALLVLVLVLVLVDALRELMPPVPGEATEYVDAVTTDLESDLAS
jgi:hypothetical protein